MEGLSGDACFHFHSPNNTGVGGSRNPGACDETLHPGWNTLASYWRPGAVSYYYDGVFVGKVTTGITSQPMYLVLGNTMPNWWKQAEVPTTMRVSYVRVWQHPWAVTQQVDQTSS